MATKKCLDNIKKETSSYNHLCSGVAPSGLPFCVEASTYLDQHCRSMQANVDDPVPTFDPYNHEWCYCCCTCFAKGTLIETSPEKFRAIEKIHSGDDVMATGREINWKKTKVEYRDGDLTSAMLPGLYCVNYLMEGESKPRNLIVSPDHLFLMNSSRTLKKVQHLIPGNKLTTKDGKNAVVQFVAQGNHFTALQTIKMEGDLNLQTLDGHLLNSNGIISADYAVQSYYDSLKDEEEIVFSFSDPNKVYEVGTHEYAKNFGCKELDEFLGDENRWPAGFVPKRHQIINIPKRAYRFLTPEQAKDVDDNGEFNPYSARTGMRNLKKLFKYAQMITPEINFILDWYNKTFNAYAWEQDGQKFAVVTGAMVRLKNISDDGWALILGFLQASHNSEFNTIGEMDYNSIENMRNTYTDDHFVNMFENAVQEIRGVFELVDKKHSAGNLETFPEYPSLDCRIQTYMNSASFFPIPQCAKPKAKQLVLEGAYASIDYKNVTVLFDLALDPDSASDIKNYQFTPEVKITGVKIDPDHPSRTILDVDGLKGQSKYLLTVENVKSTDGASIPYGEDAVIIRTP